MSDVLPSPCVGLCRLNEDDVCRGCFRHLSEISNWGLRSDVEKRQILAMIRERRQQAEGGAACL